MDSERLTALLLAARSGDADAATDFVRASQPEVWRLCAHLGARGAADDLTQETYARAFASLRRFAGRASARTWLLSIARRVCADSIREAVRDRARTSDAPIDTAIDSAKAARPGPDLADGVALHSLIAALPTDRREAFVLTQLIGLSYAEAAQVCGCPIGTIRSRVARCRDDLVQGWHAGGAADRRTGQP
jgi:RNA polymerase sigma-70 factor (ECF subfamily)